MNLITNDKQLKMYLKKVKANLQLTRSRKEVFCIMENLKQNAYTYFEENPNATFEDFKGYFGEPENISVDIFDGESNENIKKLFFKRRCFQLIAILALMLFILWGCLCIKSYISTQNINITDHQINIEYNP